MPPTQDNDANEGEPEEQPESTDLQALNEALDGPKGDFVITVESYDRDLLRELWTLQCEGVVVTESMQKAGHDPGLVSIVLQNGVLLTVLVDRVLQLVKKYTKGNKKKAKTQVLTKKQVRGIEELIAKFADSVDVNASATDEDSNESEYD